MRSIPGSAAAFVEGVKICRCNVGWGWGSPGIAPPLLHRKGERADCFGNVIVFNRISLRKNMEANYKVW